MHSIAEYQKIRPNRAVGLYRPEFEHDACGVGMICNLHGEKSHDIVRKGIDIACNLMHRGAYGCDRTTGDGAGILIQMPHEFFLRVCAQEDIYLPEAGDYGAGLVFLPQDESERNHFRKLFETVIHEKGQTCLGWRKVPKDNRNIGALAKQTEPSIFQVFIGRDPEIKDEAAFERKLFVIRKVMENRVHASSLLQKSSFYIPSLSCRTIVYKGMLVSGQLAGFFPDLTEPDMVSAMALVHQRYSTNTFPSWDLAQPFRFLCHNGEINTLRGNINWMNAREQLFASDLFGDDMAELLPIATPGASDSAILDNALELLYHTGRSLPHAIMMLIPEAWQHHDFMSPSKKAFYEYHSCLMEPWDGPAGIPFTDGRIIGTVLDRNGLRPSRYTVTKDGFVIMASETGVLEVAPENVARKERLQPGRMFLVDMEQGRIVDDEEIKEKIAAGKPYGKWLGNHLQRLDQTLRSESVPAEPTPDLMVKQKMFGMTTEDIKIILEPMIKNIIEPTGSMGDDIPPAILSQKPRLLYDYFKELFAQVTNPPLDALREKLVTSLTTTIGREQDLFKETPLHCHQLRANRPMLANSDLAEICSLDDDQLKSVRLSMLFDVDKGGDGLRAALDVLCRKAGEAVTSGISILILSDRDAGRTLAPIPAMLATAAVHHDLIRNGLRTRCGIIVETGEAREVHDFCCLFGYGAGAVNPYLVFDTMDQMIRQGRLASLTKTEAMRNYRRAVEKGILKVMSKMGISTLQSYRGAQIFECIGLNRAVVDRYFTGTSSRIGGADLDTIVEEIALRHASAFPADDLLSNRRLSSGGKYKWRRDGEAHQYNPATIALIQEAVYRNKRTSWEAFSDEVNRQNRKEGLIRGLFRFNNNGNPTSIEQVEPWTEIVKRFKTGAMSYGSISKEAHQTLAIAMNRLGAKSNSGEGGEDPDRYEPDANGDWRNSAIKQVASGRFGVTINYLSHCKEIQIKMAQGAKPGEGGQLPAAKVYPWIAKTRFATPHVGLISPPPHHDIYSIEDLAQLIYDLKNANPDARISVKLVSEIGVGTIAAGVVKAGADLVLISGDAGGTGASPQTSIRHGGAPWELGLAETNQTLLMNGLRDRVVLETDGQLKTARDVAIACLLGAEEFGFGTISLVALGCIMMRVCHLNTCPVGIATQDPELRKKFAGKPDYVVNFMRFVAEDLRRIMADLGFASINDMTGRVDRLNVTGALSHWKAAGLDLSSILAEPDVPAAVSRHCIVSQPRGLEDALDYKLIKALKPALDEKTPMQLDLAIRNVYRTVGTILSHEIVRRHGEKGLPEDTVLIRANGSAGQSFCAFGAPGLTVHIRGDANDYFGKGLSGAKLSVRPPEGSSFAAEENIIVGNVALYGATSGQAYIRGIAGERFCVRNSGAHAVVEGVGDHGCEYMTSGRVVVLGRTGRNFAAGMSGGIAYVYASDRMFARHLCNREMVLLDPVEDEADQAELRQLIKNHFHYTRSPVARNMLDNFSSVLEHFTKVIPMEYKRAIERLKQADN